MSGTGLQAFLASAHAFDCRECHAGQSGVLTKEEAHVGLMADPSAIESSVCAACHVVIGQHHAMSLHATLRGYTTLFHARTGTNIDDNPQVRQYFDRDCNKCHTTCGACHVSRPKSVGGGFIQGHNIKAIPDMNNQCTACHGSRVGDEYTGRNEGYSADVHYVPNAKSCTFCHTGAEMHGDGNEYTHRYAVENGPKCRDCHTITSGDNVYHDAHGANFACQVCHSQDYKNCTTCHAGSGLTQPSWMAFKIGRNPIPQWREGEIVVLRHIPIAEDTYENWGVSTPFYASVPTFKYTSPHNIRRWTTRTDTSGGRSCDEACHQTPATRAGFFLRQVDLDFLPEAERTANQALIVPDSPPPW